MQAFGLAQTAFNVQLASPQVYTIILSHCLPYRQDGIVDDEITSTVKT